MQDFFSKNRNEVSGAGKGPKKCGFPELKGGLNGRSLGRHIPVPPSNVITPPPRVVRGCTKWLRYGIFLEKGTHI